MKVSDWTVDHFLANQASCLEALQSNAALETIPLLNNLPAEEIKNGSIIRFRGMIQDMLDPEFYLERYAVKLGDVSRLQDGRFRDRIEYNNVSGSKLPFVPHSIRILDLLQDDETLDTESDENVNGERRLMFVLSVPGVNSWVAEVERGASTGCPTGAQSSVPVARPKRTLDEGTDEAMEVEGEAVKRVKTRAQGSIGNGVLSTEYLLNSPIPDRPSKSCMVKIYSDFEKYKLNTLVDIIGFVSVDPILDGTKHMPGEFDGIDIEEHVSTNPPPSLIPRIHAVSILELTHINPLLDRIVAGSYSGPRDTRQDLLLVLTQCLFGDEIAAQYLLCHLLSSIYARVDIENLGRCALNLSQLPTDVVKTDYLTKLYAIIELLVPASHYFPLTLDNLNTVQFVPKKDFKTNRLTSGLLQLAPHTHLIVDETRLEPGQLQSAGLTAVSSLSHLITNQMVKYDFQFYQLDFEADLPVLVFSEGKSIMPSDYHVPLVVDRDTVPLIGETLDAAKQFVRTHSLEMRKFLTQQQLAPFNMPAEVQERVQNDLVAMRREHNLMPEDFHLHLNLCRLVGKSASKVDADLESWQRAKEMERQRRVRCQTMPQRNESPRVIES